MAQESLGLRCAGFSPAFARTQSGILTSVRSNMSSLMPSQLTERSPTPHTKYEGQASAGRLIPTILGAFSLDW
jgi:hypothetical protein